MELGRRFDEALVFARQRHSDHKRKGTTIPYLSHLLAVSSLVMENGGGVILNTASTNGIMGYRYYSDYNASKAGVIELTKSMALEFAPRIRVTAVAPGYILTPMQRAEYTDEMLEEVNRKLPLKRHGSPEEVAALFAFLASEEAEYITGQVYVLDGGEIAGGLASR